MSLTYFNPNSTISSAVQNLKVSCINQKFLKLKKRFKVLKKKKKIFLKLLHEQLMSYTVSEIIELRLIALHYRTKSMLVKQIYLFFSPNVN